MTQKLISIDMNGQYGHTIGYLSSAVLSY